MDFHTHLRTSRVLSANWFEKLAAPSSHGEFQAASRAAAAAAKAPKCTNTTFHTLSFKYSR